jgi:membrane protease YdiL (CAAX protease family)
MGPILALGIYIAAIFLGGALIAPWLYWVTQASGFTHLAAYPFHRFVDRSLLVVALLGVWPLLRSLGAKSPKDVGLAPPGWKQFGAGFMLGFVSFAMIAVIALGMGARAEALTYHHLGQKVVGAGLTALGVGTLEEILFRGGLFGGLRRNLNWGVALIVSSIIYALVHFLGTPRQNGPIVWYSGLELLPRMLEGFVHWQQLVPGFFNLMISGALLALAYHRTGNLYFSIGLHAGWIFWVKSYNVLTRQVPGANSWIWGGNKLVDSWVAFLVLSITLAIFWLSAPARARYPSNSAEVPA